MGTGVILKDIDKALTRIEGELAKTVNLWDHGDLFWGLPDTEFILGENRGKAMAVAAVRELVADMEAPSIGGIFSYADLAVHNDQDTTTTAVILLEQLRRLAATPSMVVGGEFAYRQRSGLTGETAGIFAVASEVAGIVSKWVHARVRRSTDGDNSLDRHRRLDGDERTATNRRYQAFMIAHGIMPVPTTSEVP